MSSSDPLFNTLKQKLRRQCENGQKRRNRLLSSECACSELVAKQHGTRWRITHVIVHSAWIGLWRRFISRRLNKFLRQMKTFQWGKKNISLISICASVPDGDVQSEYTERAWHDWLVKEIVNPINVTLFMWLGLRRSQTCTENVNFTVFKSQYLLHYCTLKTKTLIYEQFLTVWVMISNMKLSLHKLVW